MGFMQAYDSHCNLVLGDVEETIYVVEDENEEETIRVGRPVRWPIGLWLRSIEEDMS